MANFVCKNCGAVQGDVKVAVMPCPKCRGWVEHAGPSRCDEPVRYTDKTFGLSIFDKNAGYCLIDDGMPDIGEIW